MTENYNGCTAHSDFLRLVGSFLQSSNEKKDPEKLNILKFDAQEGALNGLSLTAKVSTKDQNSKNSLLHLAAYHDSSIQWPMIINMFCDNLNTPNKVHTYYRRLENQLFGFH